MHVFKGEIQSGRYTVVTVWIFQGQASHVTVIQNNKCLFIRILNNEIGLLLFRIRFFFFCNTYRL